MKTRKASAGRAMSSRIHMALLLLILLYACAMHERASTSRAESRADSSNRALFSQFPSAPQLPLSLPSPPEILKPDERKKLDALVKKRENALKKMEKAIADRSPEQYYVQMKSLLLSREEVKAITHAAEARVERDLDKLNSRNAPFGKDSTKWPRPYNLYAQCLKAAREALPALRKADEIFRTQARNRIETVHLICRQNPETFALNSRFLERTVDSLRPPLEALKTMLSNLKKQPKMGRLRDCEAQNCQSKNDRNSCEFA